jgi:glycosyltransferase involved in cell wall biosynthesis
VAGPAERRFVHDVRPGLEPSRERGDELIPCILGPSKQELVPVSSDIAAGYLAAGMGRRIDGRRGLLAWLQQRRALAANSLPAIDAPPPTPSDHVVFTGTVWKPLYARLFTRLKQAGIPFSVLVHDIIPLEQPEFVSAAQSQSFGEWLEIVLRTASLVFVSGEITASQIRDWAKVRGLTINPRLVVTPLGVTPLPDKPWSLWQRLTGRMPPEPFVLSVGTIDKRKNQSAVCRAWVRLFGEVGDAMPTLVLVGRDDLGLARDPALRAAIVANKIRLVKEASDPALARYYHDCLFTVFPSLSEGYGLPVAESLAAGKLCLSSDLPAIKQHAGSFPWYFNAQSEDEMLGCLRRAVERPDLREASELNIREGYIAGSWRQTFEMMREAISR